MDNEDNPQLEVSPMQSVEPQSIAPAQPMEQPVQPMEQQVQPVGQSVQPAELVVGAGAEKTKKSFGINIAIIVIVMVVAVVALVILLLIGGGSNGGNNVTMKSVKNYCDGKG